MTYGRETRDTKKAVRERVNAMASEGTVVGDVLLLM
jgi:hypothetical protein